MHSGDAVKGRIRGGSVKNGGGVWQSERRNGFFLQEDDHLIRGMRECLPRLRKRGVVSGLSFGAAATAEYRPEQTGDRGNKKELLLIRGAWPK